MVKGKNRGGPVAAGPKQPKPAAAKPGVVKATARCHKPTGTFPPAGKENKNALAKSDVSEKGKKRVRVPEGTAPPDKDDCQEQQEKGGKRKRHQPTRFGVFEQQSPSLGSPDSQVQHREEPAGAAEAREAEALSFAASAMFGSYLDEGDDGPSIKEKLAPVLEQLQSDRDAYLKKKAEAKQKAAQAEAQYVPVDQRKLPSPIKRNPELEELLISRNKKDRKGCVGSVGVQGPEVSPPIRAQDQYQALNDQISDLKAQITLKEGEVERLKETAESLQEENQELKSRVASQEREIQRMKAAQSNESKGSKAIKESARVNSEVKELRKELEQVASQLAKQTSTVDTLRSRLEMI